MLLYLGMKFSRYSGLGHSDRFLISGGYKRKGGNQDDFKRKESSYHG